jgi:hypothetical protein
LNTRTCVIQVALDDWPSSARLPRELNAAGLAVIALCSANSPLRLTRYAAQVAIATPESLGVELERLILEHAPVAVIASDEQAVRHLHSLAGQASLSERTRALLHHSLGDPRFYPLLTSKWATAELAKSLNIAAPLQSRVDSVDDAAAFAGKIGFPVILKRENTYGGMGCYVCRSEGELRRGFKSLRSVSWLRRRLRTITRGSSFASPSALSRDPLIIQKYHEGRLTFVAAVACDGVMVSGLTGIAEAVYPAPTGASTVIRAVDSPELLEISRTLIAETRCSGFVGVDFMLDRTSGRPYLLEINPRVTPLCHLARLLGTDLCAAFAASFAGLCAARPPGRKIDLVALLPNEWMRDPRSPHLEAAYHDIPLDDPALVEDAYGRLPPLRRLMVRLGLLAPFQNKIGDDLVEAITPLSNSREATPT